MKMIFKNYKIEVELKAKIDGNKILIEYQPSKLPSTPKGIKERKKIMKVWLINVFQMIEENLLGIAEDLSLKDDKSTMIYTKEEKRLLYEQKNS